jgi:hypothetical protein
MAAALPHLRHSENTCRLQFPYSDGGITQSSNIRGENYDDDDHAKKLVA